MSSFMLIKDFTRGLKDTVANLLITVGTIGRKLAKLFQPLSTALASIKN